MEGGSVICRYTYTAFGECKVRNADWTPRQTDPTDIALINPFRWKSFYLDAETDWYYIDGRYYDPAICQYISADAPENLLALAAVAYGLNRYGITVDNAVALVGALYNIFSETGLMPDPSYTPKPTWQEKAFGWLQKYGRYVLYAAAMIMCTAAMILSGGTAAPGILAAMGVAAISGLVIGGVAGGIAAGLNGGDIWNAIAEGAFWGALDGAMFAMLFAAVGVLIKVIPAMVRAANAARTERTIQAANAAKAQAAATQPARNAAQTEVLNPQNIRFSQNSVNAPKTQAIIDDMAVNGWKGDPIDVVRMPDGGLTSLDNKRLLAAKLTNTPVQANIHAFSDSISLSRASSLASKSGALPTTWGQGVLNRISTQAAGFRNLYPYGSLITGWGGSI